jgi:hypothetical protein
MDRKWFKRIKRFVEQFTPGGTEHASLGTEIHYSSKGVTTVPRSEYRKILFRRLGELSNPGRRMHTESEQRDPNGG